MKLINERDAYNTSDDSNFKPKEPMPGDQIGDLHVDSRFQIKNRSYVSCTCKCGNVQVFKSYILKSRSQTRCGKCGNKSAREQAEKYIHKSPMRVPWK